MRKNYLYFIALFIIVFAACSTIKVKHVGAKGEFPENNGIYYSLPKTAITIEVTVNKIYKVKGPYAAYANKYLGLSDVIAENSFSYRLDKINLNSYSIPDSAQYYFVEVPKCNHKKNHLFLQMSETGIINGINNAGEINKNSNSVTSPVSNSEELVEPSLQTFINSGIAEKFDTTIEKIILDTTVFTKKVIKKISVEKTEEQKAKDAADLIIRIKEEKFNLLSGYSEVNYSKEAIQYMNQQLDKIGKEYLDLFTGITVKRQEKYYFTYVPVHIENTVNIPIFKFSKEVGIADTTSLHGENIYLNIERLGNTKTMASFDTSHQTEKKKKFGFYYRIPEYAKIKVILNNNVIADANLLVDQFGAVSQLPVNDIMRASFYPNSGSIKTISYHKRGCCFFRHHNFKK